jgi:hypothetical protein
MRQIDQTFADLINQIGRPFHKGSAKGFITLLLLDHLAGEWSSHRIAFSLEGFFQIVGVEHRSVCFLGLCALRTQALNPLAFSLAARTAISCGVCAVGRNQLLRLVRKQRSQLGKERL